MLSCNLPLLVWGVTLRKQEYPYIKAYVQIKSKVSTVPYWNTECGELFHNYQNWKIHLINLLKILITIIRENLYWKIYQWINV